MYSLSLFLISLRCLIECPVIIILHNVFSVCFAKPFRQAFSINIVRNKVLAGDQHRMVSYLYLSKPLEISANMPGLGGTGFEKYSSSENQIRYFNHGLQIMGVRRWRKQCEERAEWKKITEKAKTHSGL